MMTSTALPPPGCFGSPTCHAATSLPCAQCPFEASCGPIAARVAEGLRRKYGIDLLLRRVATRGRAEANSTLSARARDFVERFQARGIDLPRAVAMRTNPFDHQPPGFMRVALECLLRGGFSREELREAFMRELGWTEISAASHVSLATSVLRHLGAAVEHNGRFVPTRTEVAA